MSSAERGTFVPPEQERGQERQPFPYYRAARFEDGRLSKTVYVRAEEAIVANEGDLSALHFQIDGGSSCWHVAVFGSVPPDQLDTTIVDVLAPGESEHLVPFVLAFLDQHRQEVLQRGDSSPPVQASEEQVRILPEDERLERRRAQNREAQRRWRQRNPDEHRQQLLLYRQTPESRAKATAYMRDYRQRQKQERDSKLREGSRLI